VTQNDAPFLLRCAEEIYREHGNISDKIAVVLPGRRAGLFFRKSYSSLLKGPIASPAILGIEQYFEHLAGVSIADPYILTLELFAAWKEIPGLPEKNLEDFLTWGETALRDFNDIDNYLADPSKILSNLQDIRFIEEWSLNQPELSQSQLQYLEFWKQLDPLYQQFYKRCRELGLASEGMIKRRVSENKDLLLERNPFQFTWFLGLNALSAAEEKTIKTLITAGKARIIWDADPWFIDNAEMEAGHFIRKYREQLGPLEGLHSSLGKQDRSIHVLACSTQIAQAREAAALVSSSAVTDKIAVVLADEQLLFPLLEHINTDVVPINVSLGFPLRNTPIYELAESIIKMYLKAEANPRGNDRFYYKDVLQVLRNPAMPEALYRGDEGEIIRKALAGNRLIYPSAADLKKIGAGAELTQLLFLFNPHQSASQLLDTFVHLTDYLKSYYNAIRDLKGNENLFYLAKVVSSVRRYLSKYKWTDSIEVFLHLFRSLCRKELIPYFGEPLSGVQVLGVLETRALDFDRVILLGVNEEVFPKSRFADSLIPQDLRIAFGLPVSRDREAISAYYFYRLLSRCRHMDILYNAEPVVGMGEKSRFIAQIDHHLKDPQWKVSITEERVQSPIGVSNAINTCVPASETIREKILQLMASGLSPSAINTWRKCPLDFYFKYVAGFRESEEVEENMEVSTFGSIIHTAMEDLFTSEIGKELIPQVIRNKKKYAEASLNKAMKEHYSAEEILYGENHIHYHTALNYIHRYLDWEANELDKSILKGSKTRLIALEQNLNATIDLSEFGITTPFVLRGTADRIHEQDGVFYIIDYKTGSVTPSDLIVKGQNSLYLDDAGDKALQVMLYLFMASQEDAYLSQSLKGGIISLKKQSSGLMMWRVEDEDSFSAHHAFELRSYLASVVNNMLNPPEGYAHNFQARFCSYCH